MKAVTGKIIHVCVVLIAVGIGLLISGFILGGRKGFALDYGNKKIRYANEGIETGELELEKFDEAEISIPYASLEIVEGDSWKLEYTKSNDYDLTAEVKNGKFTLNYRTQPRELHFNIFYFESEQSFKLYVPKGTVLKKADIDQESGRFAMSGVDVNDFKLHNEYGSVSIENMKSENTDIEAQSGSAKLTNVETDKLKLYDEYGSIHFTDVTAKEAEVKAESGSVKMENVTTDDMYLKDEYGSITLDNVKSDKARLELSSGSLKTLGFESSDIDVKSEYGSVDLELKGQKEEFSYDLETEYGSIKIDGENPNKKNDDDDDKKKYVKQGGDKNIKVRAESGSIKIDFD